jgi:DNA-binding transcriptional LysR family regulator
LAQAPEPLSDDQICHHRAVAVADTARDGKGATVGLLKGQSVLTVASMQAKLEAQMRGMGVGFLPEPLAREALQSGRLVARRVKRPERIAHLSFAWRHDPKPGKALSWWLKTLDNAGIRARLIGQAR